MSDQCSIISYTTLAIVQKYAKGIGAAAVKEAVAQSKLYTDTELSKILSFEIEIVEDLPDVPAAHTLYLVPKSIVKPTNGYYEYIYVQGKWEIIGDTEVDLSNYYTKEEVDQLIRENKYVLPAATATTLGGIKIDNSTIQIDNDGKISLKEEGTADLINEVIQPVSTDDIASLFD